LPYILEEDKKGLLSVSLDSSERNIKRTAAINLVANLVRTIKDLIALNY